LLLYGTGYVEGDAELNEPHNRGLRYPNLSLGILN